MSSSTLRSSLTIPSRFRRKNSSASTDVSIDSRIYGPSEATSSSSPLLSSPLLTPLHLARPYEHKEWQTGDYLDDYIYGRQNQSDDSRLPWPCPTRSEHSVSYTQRPLPSLMTKFATRSLWGDAPLPYSPSPHPSTFQTPYFYPQGDSAVADECEEYDLESMNIHIRETYFATSSERGRWLSSPTVSRVRSHAGPPLRGYSSPIKKAVDVSPPREYLQEHTKNFSINQEPSFSFSENHDADMRCLSPLPPSSPLSSPLSNLSFLGDDYEDDAIIDPHSSSDNCNPFGAIRESSTSSTTCTSPIEPVRPSTPLKAPLVVSPVPPPNHLSNSPGSAVSCRLSPRPSCSLNPIDAPVYAPNSPSFESDGALSPLSQFELDLPEAEPMKLPLSDMENRFYPGQHMANLGVGVGAVRSHNGPPPIQFSLPNSNNGPRDATLETIGRLSIDKNAKKRRANAISNPSARQTKKRAAVRSGAPSGEKRRKGVENYTSNYSEPPRKKPKLLRYRDHNEGKPRRNEIPKAQRRSRSFSPSGVERCDAESSRACSKKTPMSAVQLQQSTAVSRDHDGTEFRASLTGMLVEALATSRATSMDSSAMYHVLKQAHPYLVAMRSKQELLIDIASVLEAGRARCGMFEKVDCSGDRSRHRELESRWFYVPERDEDEERAGLISAIMPRQKRNETKKYKQYYYQPLDKISRWDPEDAP